MPRYRINSPDGGTMLVEGDEPPDESTIAELFASRKDEGNSPQGDDMSFAAPKQSNAFGAPDFSGPTDLARDIGGSATLPTPMERPTLESDQPVDKWHELQNQKLAVQDEGVPDAWRLAASASSGIDKGVQLPTTVLRVAESAALALPITRIGLGAWKAVLPKKFGEAVDAVKQENAQYFTDLAKWEKWMSERDAMLGTPTFGTEVTEGAFRAFAELPLQLMGGVGAPTEAAAVKGASIMGGLVSGIQRFSQERGEGADESTAAMRAAQSALITGLTTRAFGATGIQSIYRKEGVEGLSKKMWSVLKEAGMEGAEESVDQLQQELADYFQKNPDKPIEDSVHDVVLSGIVGAALGGAMGTVHETFAGKDTKQPIFSAEDVQRFNKNLPQSSSGVASPTAEVEQSVNKTLEQINSEGGEKNGQAQEGVVQTERKVLPLNEQDNNRRKRLETKSKHAKLTAKEQEELGVLRLRFDAAKLSPDAQIGNATPLSSSEKEELAFIHDQVSKGETLTDYEQKQFSDLKEKERLWIRKSNTQNLTSEYLDRAENEMVQNAANNANAEVVWADLRAKNWEKARKQGMDPDSVAGQPDLTDESGSNPFSSRQRLEKFLKSRAIATIDRVSGRIILNPRMIREVLDGLPSEDRKQAIDSIINEEKVHLHTSDKTALAYWKGLGKLQQVISNKIYTGEWGGNPEGMKFSQTQLAHEALRRHIQHLNGMTPTEIAQYYDRGGMTVQALDTVDRAINSMRRTLSGLEGNAKQIAYLDEVQKNLQAGRKILVGQEPKAYRKKSNPISEIEDVPIEEWQAQLKQSGYKDQTKWSYDFAEKNPDITSEELMAAKKRAMKQSQDKGFPDQGMRNQFFSEAAKWRQALDEANALENPTKEQLGQIEQDIGVGGLDRGAELQAALDRQNQGTPSFTDEHMAGKYAEFEAEKANSYGVTPELEDKVNEEIDSAFGFYDQIAQQRKRLVEMGREGKLEHPSWRSAFADLERKELDNNHYIEALQNLLKGEDDEEAPMAFRPKRRMTKDEQAAFDAEQRRQYMVAMGQIPDKKEPKASGSAPRKVPMASRTSASDYFAKPTSESIDTEASKVLSDAQKAPSFDRFMDFVRSKHGNVQPGQVEESWQQNVSKYLEAATGERLAWLVDKLGLRRQVYGVMKKQGVTLQLGGTISDTREVPGEYQAKLRAEKRAENMLKKAAELDVLSSNAKTEAQAKELHQQALILRRTSEALSQGIQKGEGFSLDQNTLFPGIEERNSSLIGKRVEDSKAIQYAKIMGREMPESAKKAAYVGPKANIPEIVQRGRQINLRNRAITELYRVLTEPKEDIQKSLNRSTLSVDDVRWNQDSNDVIKVRPADVLDPDMLALNLTQRAGTSATTKKIRGGGKMVEQVEALPRSATKRVVALEDRQSGKVHLVSAYRDGYRGPVFYDPASINKAYRTLDELLPRYKPLYSIPLDQPVQHFIQTFGSAGEFNQKFYNNVEEAAKNVGYRGYRGEEEDFTPEGNEAIEGEGGMMVGAKGETEPIRAYLGMLDGVLDSPSELTENEARAAFETFSATTLWEDVHTMFANLKKKVGARESNVERNIHEKLYDLQRERDQLRERIGEGEDTVRLEKRLTEVDRQIAAVQSGREQELTPREWSLISAMRKVSKVLLEGIPAKYLPLFSDQEIAEMTLNELYATAQLTQTERAFVKASQRDYTAQRGRADADQTAAQRPSPYEKELTMPIDRVPPTVVREKQLPAYAPTIERRPAPSPETGKLGGLVAEESDVARRQRRRGETTDYGAMFPKAPTQEALRQGIIADYMAQKRPEQSGRARTKSEQLSEGGIAETPGPREFYGSSMFGENPPPEKTASNVESAADKAASEVVAALEKKYGGKFGQSESERVGNSIQAEEAPAQSEMGLGGKASEAEPLNLPRAPKAEPEQGEMPFSLRRAEDRSLTENLRNLVSDVGSIYDKWMVDRIAEYGGVNAKRFASGVREIIARQHELYGGLTPLLDRVRRMSGGIEPSNESTIAGKVKEIPRRTVESAKHMRAVNWLNKVVPITPYGATANMVRAIEGQITTPDFAKKLVRMADAANREIGKLLEPVTKNFMATGGIERHLTSFGYDIIRQGGGKLWDRWIDATWKANKWNGITKHQVETSFKNLKKLLDDPQQNAAGLEQINQDMARLFPVAITHIKHLKMWQPVIHADLFNYLENAAQRATHVRSFREQFPLNDQGKQAFRRLYLKVQAELADEPKRDLDAVVRTLHGHPTDEYTSQFHDFFRTRPTQFIGQSFRTLNQTVGNLMAKMVLTGQVAAQSGETVSGAAPIYFGYRNYLKGMVQAKGLYRSMEITGAVNRVFHDYTFNPNSPLRSTFRIAGNVLSKAAFEATLNEAQEALGASVAIVAADNIKNGNLTAFEKRQLPLTFRDMGFNPKEVDLMMDGDQRLLRQMVNKSASFLSGGNKAIAENSRMGANRLFNSVFRFSMYPMTKMNQTRKIVTGLIDTFSDPNATAKDRIAEAEHAGRFFGGTFMQGALTSMVITAMTGGLGGLKIKMNEWKDEPWKFFGESIFASLSGPLYFMWRLSKMNGLTGMGEQAARIMFPYGIANDIADAVQGNGQYRDQSAWGRAGKFLENKNPGLKMLKTGMALFGLGEKSQELDQALSGYGRWSRDEFGWRTMQGSLKNDEREQFRVEIRNVIAAMKSGDSEAFDRAWLNATGESDGRGVAASLKKRKVLQSPDGKDLTPEQVEKVKNRIGMDAYEQLQKYDMMLDYAARGIMLE